MEVAENVRNAALPRFLLLYAVLYGGFGVISPFFSPLLAQHGISPSGIGVVLGLGTAVRLFTGPAAGNFSDRHDLHRALFAACALAAAASALGYLPVDTLWLAVAVSLVQAAVQAPLTPIADALALAGTSGREKGGDGKGPAAGKRGFDYGWVRGAGSAAFVLGSIGAGHAIGGYGLNLALWLNAGLLAAAAGCVMLIPRIADSAAQVNKDEAAGAGDNRFAALLRLPRFGWLMLVAALIESSQAMHDTFAALRWSHAGISPGTIGWIWSESVAAEVLVFLVLGPWLLRRLSPAAACAVAAAGSALRWAVLGSTTAVPLLALAEPLHGCTFALTHLAAMRLIARSVPRRLSATAQAFYGTVAVGAATVVINLAGGPLYSWLDGGAFWCMAVQCAIALPLCMKLRDHSSTA